MQREGVATHSVAELRSTIARSLCSDTTATQACLRLASVSRMSSWRTGAVKSVWQKIVSSVLRKEEVKKKPQLHSATFHPHPGSARRRLTTGRESRTLLPRFPRPGVACQSKGRKRAGHK